MLTVTDTHLRTVLDGIPAPIALVDNEGRHWYVNDAYTDQFGLPAADILGRTIAEILGEQVYAELRPGDPQQPHMDRARQGEVVHWEGWLGYPDGERYVQRRYFPYHGDDGTVEGVFAYSRDVTALKQAQLRLTDQVRELQQAHAHMRAVLDSIPGRVALLDRTERHRYANREYCEFVGIPIDKLIGKTRAQAIGKAAAALIRPLARQALAGETVRWAGWVTYRQGVRYVERVNFPYRNDAGEVDGYFNFTRDLTELKLEQQQGAHQAIELQGSEARNAAITASALDCIVATDEAGRIVEFNPAAEHTFGYRRADVLGHPVGELLVPPRHRRRLVREMARHVRTGHSTLVGQRIEVEAMRRDGTTFPAELAMTEVRLPNRRLFTAYLRDLTAVRQAEQEIVRQREALHQTEKMASFGSLLAGVAHELNNPLSIVIGNALMLAEDAGDLAPGLAARAQRIQAAAERCGRITQSFLAMARANKRQSRLVPVQYVVDNALQLLAYGLRASGVTLDSQLPGNLPPIQCDPDQITQVLVNLLVNARQVLEQQPQPRLIRIAAAVLDDTMEVTVADNGPGIPAGIQSRIFDPFFTTKPVGSGTGIGLSVSRGIAEAHGGSLALSPADTGACFALRLPTEGGGAGIAEAPPAPDAAPPPRPAPRRRALILDDEVEIAQVLSEMLGAHGYDCELATNGELVKQRLLDAAFDLVLCDLRLPGVDGPALFAWMQVHAPHYCDRTAFVTGDTLGQAAGTFLARANRPVLEKPFGPAALRRVLDDLAPSTGHQTDIGMTGIVPSIPAGQESRSIDKS